MEEKKIPICRIYLYMVYYYPLYSIQQVYSGNTRVVQVCVMKERKK